MIYYSKDISKNTLYLLCLYSSWHPNLWTWFSGLKYNFKHGRCDFEFFKIYCFSSRSNLLFIKYNKYFNCSIYNSSGPAGKEYSVHSKAIPPFFRVLYLKVFVGWHQKASFFSWFFTTFWLLMYKERISFFEEKIMFLSQNIWFLCFWWIY